MMIGKYKQSKLIPYSQKKITQTYNENIISKLISIYSLKPFKFQYSLNFNLFIMKISTLLYYIPKQTMLCLFNLVTDLHLTMNS